MVRSMAPIIALETATWGALIAAVASLLTAAASLVVTLVTSAATRRNAADLARLDSDLQVARAVGDARRDYEYDARKRLYAECEPLLFQASELAQGARYRIRNLAEAVRRGGLREDGTGWLAKQDYYFESTLFLLLAPSATFKVLHRRLTTVDLGLEPEIKRQYELLKGVWFTFAADWDLAQCDPAVPYDPDKADPGEPDRDRLLRDRHAEYWRQGMYRGILERVSEAMIVPVGNDSRERCQSMGEFWSAYQTEGTALAEVTGDLSALFTGFHPRRKPVLWRVFLAQYLFYGTLLGEEFGTADVEQLDWRGLASDATDKEVWDSLRAGHAYVQSRVSNLAPLQPSEEAK